MSTPSNRSSTIRGRRMQFHGMIKRNRGTRFQRLNFLTGSPRNSPPPPQSEYNRSFIPFACNAATSRCRKVSEVFGNVVNSRAMMGEEEDKDVELKRINSEEINHGFHGRTRINSFITRVLLFGKSVFIREIRGSIIVFMQSLHRRQRETPPKPDQARPFCSSRVQAGFPGPDRPADGTLPPPAVALPRTGT